MDVDRRELAAQLDDVVFGVRRLTQDRSGLSLTAEATLTTLRRSGPSRLTDLAVTEGVSQPAITALVGRPADRRREDRAARLAQAPTRPDPISTHP
ncbi:MAG: Transcriptional regulator, MarR family [Modestobacter sp.]|nr:Transcriptional regulator, MarR family [Modestobacter sp.]